MIFISTEGRVSFQFQFILYFLIHILLFFLIFIFHLSYVSDYIYLFSAFLVVVVSLTQGKWTGIISGSSILIVQNASLAANNLNSISNLFSTENMIKSIMLPLIGLLVGLLSENWGKFNLNYAKKLNDIKLLNNALDLELSEHKSLLINLVADSENVPNEDLLLNLIGSSVSHSSLRQRYPQDSRFELLTFDDSISTSMLYDQLIILRPDLLAVLNLQGEIKFINSRLMAIFGYNNLNSHNKSQITDYLIPEDIDAAAENIRNVLSPLFNKERIYNVKSADHSFSRIIVAPRIKFERFGKPMSIVVSLNSQELYCRKTFPGSLSEKLTNIADLYNSRYICLSANRTVTFIESLLIKELGLTPRRLLNMDIKLLIDERHLDQFDLLLESCIQGKPETQILEFRSFSGKRHFYMVEIFPTIGMTGQFLGAVIMLNNVTNEEIIKERFDHRLALEKLISLISTQFISIDVNQLEQAIESVLKNIGNLEGAHESYVEIYPSDKIKNGLKCSVVNQHQSGNDQSKTISIPIRSEAAEIGQFRFVQSDYQSEWLDEDIELIHLIGEIIINALIRKENELQIILNEMRLLTTLHSIGDAVIATDERMNIIFINRIAELLIGCNFEKALHKPLPELFNPIPVSNPFAGDVDQEIESENEFGTSNFHIFHSIDGEEYYISYSQAEIRDANGTFYGHVTTFRDVTKQKLESDEIRYISYHDKLTGLYNRAFFEEEMIRLNTPRQYPITIILGDCNGLKIANDIFGHLEGDKLLQNISEILKEATRKEDIVARWGGDEFAIILPRTDEKSGAEARDRILKICSEAKCDPIQPSIALGSATNTEGEISSSDLQSVLRLAEDRMYRHKLMERKSSRNSILQSLEKMIFEKSNETEEHARRMTQIADKLGHELGLNDFELEELSLLAVLHDIGKIGIPDSILQKPEQLDEVEWEIMKRHTVKGFDLAKSTPELNNISESILHHHEHWDGHGYPSGLSGENIPKLSRILSVIDAYDVITNARPYKNAQSKEDAINEIRRCSGSQFDPLIVESFIEIMKP